MGKGIFLPVLAGNLLLVSAGFCQPAPENPIQQPEHVRYMVLDRSWPVKRVRFFPGEKIAFKLHDEKGWNRGTIQAVHKHSLVIIDAEIPFSDIRKIRVARKDYTSNFAALSGASLISGGILFIGMGAINEIKHGGGEVLVVGGATAIVLGLLTRQLTRHTWRVGGNHKLKSI